MTYWSLLLRPKGRCHKGSSSPTLTKKHILRRNIGTTHWKFFTLSHTAQLTQTRHLTTFFSLISKLMIVRLEIPIHVALYRGIPLAILWWSWISRESPSWSWAHIIGVKSLFWLVCRTEVRHRGWRNILAHHHTTHAKLGQGFFLTFYFVLKSSQLAKSDSFRWTVKRLSHPYRCICSPPNSPPSRLPCDTEQSPLCCPAGPCWFSMLNTAVCPCPSQTPWLSLPPSFPLGTIRLLQRIEQSSLCCPVGHS